MNILSAARGLTGDTLAFHLLLVTFGVGLPIVISIFELIYLINKKPYYKAVVKTWTKALVVLFIAGAVSGMIVSMSFSIIWPQFISFAGKVVGVGFALEGFAFFVEVLFLLVYVLSFDKFKPIYHWLISLMLVISSSGSAFFITSVNAWMNDPTGFRLNSKGQPIDINPWKAIFNKATPTEVSHSIVAYILCVLLVLLAVHSWPFLKNKYKKQEVKYKNRIELINILVILALIFSLAVAVLGDASGKYLAKNEPYKLAAAEGIIHTQSHAPLVIGDIVHGNSVSGGLKIPGLLSYLSTGSTKGVVIGLDSFPASQRPPLYVHYFFDAMAGIGTFIVGYLVLYVFFVTYRKKLVGRKFLTYGFLLLAILGMCAVEFGWLTTEFGRQPYIIHGVMLVSQAVNHSKTIIGFSELFPVLYVILFILTIIALKRIKSEITEKDSI
ncbi:MAG TPA: cytochrome ubiquinol oxidase subunit I [Candidatus Saccharimonadia bacterium]|nr:cytochrome ubiquinol oxidase subunit I [Candidatus Saccharimonadia bacterium]